MNNKKGTAAFRYPTFRAYFAIRFFFTFAYQMQATVIGFYIYALTHSKVAIAFTGLSEVIPAIGAALYGGYVADRCEKRKMLLLVYSGVLFTALILLIATLRPLGAFMPTGRILGIIYSMLFLNGIARAFYEPAIFSLFSHSVPRDVYPNASNWNNVSWQVAFILGPVAGGFLYAFGDRSGSGFSGMSATFTVICLLLGLSLLLVSRLKKYPAVYTGQESPRESIMAGIRFVRHHKVMLYTMSLDLFTVLFGGVTALLPVYAIDILHVGAAGLGIMRMTFSAGAALTMLLLVRYPPLARPWRNLLIAVAGFGCAIIGFGLAQTFILSLVFLFAQGAFDTVSVIIRSTLLQLLTPDKMRGRVSAINSLFIGSSSEIGNFESGMAAKLLGTIPAVLFGGGMTLLIAGLTWIQTKKQLRLSLEELTGGQED